MKTATKEVIQSICSHWICADEKEVDEVAKKLDDAIDKMVSERTNRSANKSEIFFDKHRPKVNPSGGFGRAWKSYANKLEDRLRNIDSKS